MPCKAAFETQKLSHFLQWMQFFPVNPKQDLRSNHICWHKIFVSELNVAQLSSMYHTVLFFMADRLIDD